MPVRVVIVDCDLPSEVAENRLQAAGFEVERAHARTVGDVLALVDGADALIVQWAPIDEEVLANATSLQLVSRLGIGYDMIDVAAATRHGVAVTNTPTYCVDEVAAHTIAMVMAVARGLVGYDQSVRAGSWAAVQAGVMAAARPGTSVLGVIGFGRIGRLVATHGRALGFRVLVHDPYVAARTVDEAGLEPVDLATLLAGSDVVTLHVPLSEETRHTIDADALALMKPGAGLVNTCRGGLVDTAALAGALVAGQLSAAALDVFEREPLAPEDEILRAPRCLLSPHAAWYSPESLAALPVHAADNVIGFFQGRPGLPVVNPEFATARRRAR